MTNSQETTQITTKPPPLSLPWRLVAVTHGTARRWSRHLQQFQVSLRAYVSSFGQYCRDTERPCAGADTILVEKQHISCCKLLHRKRMDNNSPRPRPWNGWGGGPSSSSSSSPLCFEMCPFQANLSISPMRARLGWRLFVVKKFFFSKPAS